MHGIDRAVRSNVFLTALIWASFFALPASAEMFGSDHPACGHQPNTVAIVDCLNTKTGVWDRRLNSAFQGLKQRISPDQTDALQTAQRL